MSGKKKTIRQLYAEHKGKVSDKWTLYLSEYDRILRPYRDKPIRLLEIGVQNGGSLEIWAEYFSTGSIFIGCDNDPNCQSLNFEDGRISLVIGDAAHETTRNEILSHSPEFDIIIDDGSHRSSEVIRSFAVYFPALVDGGIYVVEDLHASYWEEYEGGLFFPYSSISFFKRLADIIQSDYWGIERWRSDLLEGFRNAYGVEIREEILQHIRSVEFLPSLCIVHKSRPLENSLGPRIVAGEVARIDPDIIALHGSLLKPPPQSLNPWSARIRPPDEQVVELEHELQVRGQLALREQELQALRGQVAERERQVQALTARIRGITMSKAWRVAMLLRRTWALLVLPFTLRRNYKEALIRRSGLFDRDWYLARNPDVAEAGVDPARHYLLFGGFEGRDPSPNFSSRWYLETYSDVRQAAMNPLVHYLRFGRREGRATKPQEESSPKMGLWEGGIKSAKEPIYSWSRLFPVWRQERARAVLSSLQRLLPGRIKEMIPKRVRQGVVQLTTGDGGNMPEALRNGKIDYSEWIIRNDVLSDDDRLLIRSHIASLKSKPKFSILMPVYNGRPMYLRQAIDSVLGQLYQNWELCVAANRSTERQIHAILEDYAQKDARIRPYFRPINGSISACTNTALDMASGDWVVLMNHDDVLAEHALYLVAEAINSYPDATIIYSDEDRIDSTGQRSSPYFKPDWDYDLFLGQNLINHLGSYRVDLARRVGGFREGFEGAQDWDFALRILESAPNSRVHHIPFVLYHSRHTNDTFSQTSMAVGMEAAQRAVNEHFERTGQPAIAIARDHSNYLQIKWNLPADRPLVSIIIPTKDKCELLRTCVDGLLNRTEYNPIEIVIVDNGSTETDAVLFLAEIQSCENVKVVYDSLPFNYSRLINRGVFVSSGEICLLLNNDINVINPDWLEEMVSIAIRPQVGAVGAKLYYANNTIQHGGVILGYHNKAGSVAGHAHRSLPWNSSGYFNRLKLTQNLSAVTGACLAVRRDVYDQVGGFNERDLAVSFNDVDFCLRIRQLGYLVIWTPRAELYHYESVSRGHPNATPESSARNKEERIYMRKKWAKLLDNDPFYNPNLSLASPYFELDIVSRVRKPWFDFQFSANQNLEQNVAAALQRRAGRSKLELSVRRRLSQIDWYKDQIADHIRIRSTKSRKPEESQRIAIYTAISDDYDSIKLPERIDPHIDYILFTNRPAYDTGVWQIRPMTYFADDKTRMARFVKTHPHVLLYGYDIAIWIDSNIMILGDIAPIIDEFLRSGKPVGAIPHPMRESICEEIEACIRYRRDDPDIMHEQLSHYRSMGFDINILIESNFLIFNLRDERTRHFLDAWWGEIERYSKRDQLSLPYALKQTGVAWHPLMQRPNSIRNHRAFAFATHDHGKGPVRDLINSLNVALIDPYKGPSYAESRDERIAAQRHRRVDIVVCVHNALEQVKLCLGSIQRARKGERQRLIIIDDGSGKLTARYLEEFAASAPWVELHRNPQAQGYTKAANQGLAASTGELVILLNSDTIVTDGWVEKMADAVFSTAGAGIVGPMSNAASHQSIPEHRGTRDQTAVNELPPGLTAEDMNRYCEEWTAAHLLPRVPLIHGFCFGMTRGVIDRIGFLDEDNFPNGYGEENDYCFRAADAGFGLVIATHTYIFHAKSKSYSEKERVLLMKEGMDSLRQLHGRHRIVRAVRSMQENPILEGFRQRAWQLYDIANSRAESNKPGGYRREAKIPR